jgi:LemA protein
MGTAITVIIILLVVVAVVALVAMSAYNGFVKSRNLIQESWRQVDVELNRRYELIPNLVETVRAYAAHERNTLEDITRLRSQAQQLSQSEGALPSQQRADVEAQLSGAVRNLIVSVEAYPDLKSNTNFLELQRQLAETEDRIANGRRYYNANVRVYNTKVESVPTNIIANVFKFEKATYFEVNDPAVRQAPNVSFGEIAYRGDPQQAGGSSQGQLPQQGAPGYDNLPNPQQQYASPPQQYGQPPQQGQPQYQQPPQQTYAPPSPQGQQPPYQQPQHQPPQYQSPQHSAPPQHYAPPQTGAGQEQPNPSGQGGYTPPQSSDPGSPSSGSQQPGSAPGGYQPPNTQ